MNKKNLFTIVAIATSAGLSAVTLYLVNKNKKRTMSNSNNEEIYEDNINTPINVDTDDECTDILDTDNQFDNDYPIHRFIAYLVKNNVDVEEVISIAETITRIKQDLPEHFPAIRQKIDDMMASEFNLDASHEFDKENFKLMYSSIDPCQLFIKNGFKILAMGPDYQEPMMDLADAISDLKETNFDEAMQVIYEIYHIFNDLDSDDITTSTFDTLFKQYVEKYVKNTSNAAIDEGITEQINTEEV